MDLRVPDEVRQALQVLVNWPLDLIPKLVAAIRDTKPTLVLSEFAQQVAKETGQTASEVEAFLSALSGLYLIQTNNDQSPELTARELCASLKLSDGFADVPKQAWAAIEQLFSQLLSCHDSFGVTAKVGTVMTDHTNTFMDARFISDIRPVFGGDPKAKPIAAVVVHNLSVIVRHLNRVDEILIGLDSADLQKLKKLIARAEQKEKALQAIIGSAGIQYFEPKS